MNIQSHLLACIVAGVISVAAAESSAKHSNRNYTASSSAFVLLPKIYEHIPIEASLYEYIPDNFCLLEEKSEYFIVHNTVEIIDDCIKNSEIRLLLNK
tara:strand:+ start:636 stop:929 length:294 start_codon:yes stop_codon:yes gene_type:complete